MKMPMTDRSMESMGPVKAAAKSGGKMRDEPHKVNMNVPVAVKPASKREQLRSGGPGVGAKGGMSHAVSALAKMKP